MIDYSRKINIIGDIDESSYAEFVEAIDGIAEIHEEEPVYIELCSHGGDALIALAFYERILRHPGEVQITAIGTVNSAAVIILAAGDKRRMTKNSWVMVHDDTTLIAETTRVSQAENMLKTSRKLEDQWCRILEERTKIKASEWQRLHENETYLSADECKKLGLVDKVI